MRFMHLKIVNVKKCLIYEKFMLNIENLIENKIINNRCLCSEEMLNILNS